MMPRGRWDLTVLTALGAGTLLAGCGAYADGLEAEAQSEELEIGSVEQAITGGTGTATSRLISNDTDFPAVFRLVITNSGQTISCSAFRTGTLRSLTAAHCFDHGVVNGVQFPSLFDGTGTNPNSISVTAIPGDGNDIGSSPNVNDDGVAFTIAPGRLWVHPSYVLQDGVDLNHNGPDFYDVAEFKSPDFPWQPATLTVSPTERIVSGDYLGVGFGQDANDPTRNGKKQAAVFHIGAASTFQSMVSTTGALPVGGRGDSGGPLLNSSTTIYDSTSTGQRTAIGMFHAGNQADGTSFIRLPNVYDWIQDTTTANDVSLFQAGKTLFFYQNWTFSNGTRSHTCMAQSPAGSADAVTLQPCTGALDLEDGGRAPPGWELVSAAGGAFLIKNRSSGRCLAMNSSISPENKALELHTCATDGDAAQKWTFATIIHTGPAHYRTLRILNASPPNRCISLKDNALGVGTAVSVDTCDVGGTDDSPLSWVATR